MLVTFDRTWVLAIAWLPLAWILFEWRRTARKLGLILKAACFTAILLALAEPRMILQETKVALAVLVDTSASSSPADLQRASQLAQTMSGAQGRHWMRVVPFARSTRDLTPGEQQSNLELTSTSGEAGRATDLEAAVREAIASLPAGMVPRVALISDGKENKGSIARAAWQAQQLGIPIDTFALAGRAEPALRLESVSLPSIAFTGEQFPIDVVVSSPSTGPAQVELSAEGKPLGQTQVTLSRGDNPLRLHASLNTPGALDISVAIRAGALGEVHFDQAVVLRQPKVLYITQDTAAQDSHFPATLASAQFDVNRANDLGTVHLNDYQLVIFNNWDLEAIPASGKQALEQYVQQGGGLLVIGGERNLYKEDKKVEDPLERALPAKLAPPRSPEGTAVVLIIDKSSSMEGRKMELARVAAIGVVENLRPIDQVGVLIFDNSFEWAVPIRRAEDKVTIKRLISGITPDGGTQIAPALTEAYRRIRPVHGHLQAHRSFDRRYFGGGRQPGPRQGGRGAKDYHFHGRLGTGRESQLSGARGFLRRRKIIFPDRAPRLGAAAAARRAGAYRIDHGGDALWPWKFSSIPKFSMTSAWKPRRCSRATCASPPSRPPRRSCNSTATIRF